MSWQRIKGLKEKRADIQKQMKQILDGADTEKRDTSADENQRFDDLSKQSDEITGQIRREERMIELDAEAQRDLPQPGREDSKPEDTETRDKNSKDLEKRHTEAVDTFLRHGAAGLNNEQRALFMADQTELRALSVSGFGVVGPRGFYPKLVQSMKGYTGVLEAGAEVMNTSTGNQIPIPTSDDTSNSGHILGEAGEETNTDTAPTVGNVNMDAYRYSSKFIRVSLELLQDADFDVISYVLGIAGQRIGRALNAHTTNGDGSNKPRGFAVAASGQIVEAADDVNLTYDDLLDLMNGVDASYWNTPSSGFQLHQTTLIGARKLKDDNGQPIWSPAFGDVEERLMGKKVTINNSLSVYGGSENDVVGAFGDWSQYKVRNVSRPVITRANEKFIEFGQIGFIVFSRHDGDLADSKAIALLDLPAGS